MYIYFSAQGYPTTLRCITVNIVYAHRKGEKDNNRNCEPVKGAQPVDGGNKSERQKGERYER